MTKATARAAQRCATAPWGCAEVGVWFGTLQPPPLATMANRFAALHATRVSEEEPCFLESLPSDAPLPQCVCVRTQQAGGGDSLG